MVLKMLYVVFALLFLARPEASTRHLHASQEQIREELLRQRRLPPAHYRITSSGVEMLVRETWVGVPRGIIEYRMLEGDSGETNGGHWCGERYEGGFVTYCAFLPPTLAAAP